MLLKKCTVGMGFRKKVAAVCLFVGILICLSWDSLTYVQSLRMPFLLREGPDYNQLLPNTVNISSISLETRKVYTHYEQQYDLRIIVIVYNRAQSMLRLLKSLNNAKYYNDDIKLEVWIDRSANGSVDQLTLTEARQFDFYHGSFEVIIHPNHVGIIGQWLSTWRMWQSGKEMAVILEDDLQVSKYFYKYLKLVHEKYDSDPQVNGYALQGVSMKHQTSSPGILRGPKHDIAFLYPVLGTWGFSPSPKNWAKFIDWFTKAYKDKSFEPYVYSNVVTVWYKQFRRQGKTGGIWSIWHIYYAWQEKEYTLYPNFQGK